MHINRWSNTIFFDVQMYYNVLLLNTMLTVPFHCLTKSSSSLCHLIRRNIWTQSSLHIREWRLHPSVCAGKINVDIVCPAHTPSCSSEYSPSKYIKNKNYTSPLPLPPSMLKTPSCSWIIDLIGNPTSTHTALLSPCKFILVQQLNLKIKSDDFILLLKIFWYLPLSY